MNPFARPVIVLAVFFLVACSAPFVSAFTVTSVDVKPPGFQSAGTPMEVISILNFQAAGATTFSPDHDLKMSTDLVDPYWVPIVVLDGKETRLQITGGEELVIPGELLSYPPSQSVQLMVTMTGKIPSDRQSDETIVKIQERDAAKNAVATAHVAMPEVPLIPQTTPGTPTKKPTTAKVFTPIATDTTPASPAWAGAGIIAIAAAALLVLKRR